MAIGTKVEMLRSGEALNEFLKTHDVLSIQLSQTYRTWGREQIAENVWVVWYKED